MANPAKPTNKPFWETKTLLQLSPDEWEALCDGCGRCCLVKLEDDDTGQVYNTTLSCKLLNTTTCRCCDYSNRHTRVDDCIRLEPGNVTALKWLPSSCAYRRIAEGRGLADWHPLISGAAGSVIAAGISVAGKVTNEIEVDEEDAVDHMFDWPDW